MMDKEQLDRLFDEVFESAIQDSLDIKIPDPSPSWAWIEKKIAIERKKRNRRKFMRLVGMIAASLLIGAVLFGTPQVTEAFQPVIRLFFNVKGGVVTLFYGDANGAKQNEKGALTEPPMEVEGPRMGNSNVSAEDVEELKAATLEEARKLTKSPLPELTYVPEGYELLEIKMSVNKDRILEGLTYTFWVKNDKSRFFSFVAVPVQLNKGMSLLGQEQAESVNIRGTAGSFVQKADGKVLIWIESGMSYKIYGNLTENELMRIAEKIK